MHDIILILIIIVIILILIIIILILHLYSSSSFTPLLHTSPSHLSIAPLPLTSSHAPLPRTSPPHCLVPFPGPRGESRRVWLLVLLPTTRAAQPYPEEA